jgi:hypothetical protein
MIDEDHHRFGICFTPPSKERLIDRKEYADQMSRRAAPFSKRVLLL